MAIDEYFLCRSSWKGQGSDEGRQCICMRILLARYMVNVKVSELEWLCCDRALSLHVGLHIPSEPD